MFISLTVWLLPTLIIRQVIIPNDFPWNIISTYRGENSCVCLWVCLFLFNSEEESYFDKVFTYEYIITSEIWQSQNSKGCVILFFFLSYVSGT